MFGISMSDFFRNIKHRYQRQQRGFSNEDTWSFDSYLASVIIGGVKHLKENLNGHPSDITNLQIWKDILTEIIWTFETIEKMINMELLYFVPKNKQKSWTSFNKKHNTNVRYMTYEEHIRYINGWSYFQKYFMSLWD